jgi:predicted MFS family arabinose efflux permease
LILNPPASGPDTAAIRVLPAAVAAVIAAGVVAALQVGKAAVAIPLLQAELGLTLGAVAWLAAIFPLVGVFGGVPAGSAVTAGGDRRILILGLGIIAAGSAAGAAAASYGLLLVSRVIEGLGFLLIVVAAPTILRRITAERRRNQVLAGWSCFIPTGMALALLLGPLFPGWRALWWTTAALAAIAAVVVRLTVPAAPETEATPWRQLAADVNETVRSRSPLRLAACFGLYTVMYYAMFSFLPVMLIERMGVSHRTAGLMSAVAVAANIAGNLCAGSLLARGVARPTLVIAATLSMGLTALGIYLPLLADTPTFLLCVLFSAVAGVVPATLVSGASLLAPRTALVPVTVGLVMQGSNLGQLAGPAIVGNLVAAQGWSAAAVVVALTAALAAGVALRLRN